MLQTKALLCTQNHCIITTVMLNILRVRVAFLSSEYLLLAQDPALEYGFSLPQGAAAPVELNLCAK